MFSQYSKERNLVMSFRLENFGIDLYSDIYRMISLKLDMMIETTKLYIFIRVWMTLTFIQGLGCMRNQSLWCPFYCIYF